MAAEPTPLKTTDERAGPARPKKLEGPSEDRQRFEEVLIELSADLAGARFVDRDAAINSGLRRLASYLGQERAFLGRLSERRLRFTHHWISENLAPHQAVFLQEIDADDSWLATECLQGETVVISDLDDLPADAILERKYFAEHDLQSTILVPGILGSKVVGAILLDSHSRGPDWSTDRIQRLRLAVELLFSALARHETRVHLEQELQFERVLSELSATFINLPAESVDANIESGLGRLGRCLGMDLGTLLQLDPKGTSIRVTHEWHDDDMDPKREFRGLTIDEPGWPWLGPALRRNRPIRICRLDEFPPEAEFERETCEEIGIRSVLWVPYEVSGVLRGFVAFNTTRNETVWTDDVVRQLRLAGEVFGNALERARADRELKRFRKRLEADNFYLREEVSSHYQSEDIVGGSPALQEVLGQARQVAQTGSTVLVLGETGTGKELLARFIHQHSDRRDRPLVKVNCGALPATLVEAELFGRERGAYTGALSKQVGRFEIADGTTIFLDEIGDLPLELQVKLLRVLQDGELERLGSSKTVTVDARVIAATNRDLGEAVREGRFREDLFYRLNVFPITMPPLRERPEDIPDLVWTFVHEFVETMGKSIESIPRQTMENLTRGYWPGNVRELRNVVERAMIMNRGPELQIELTGAKGAGSAERPDTTLLDDVQRRHILEILDRTRWRLRGSMGAAELLGLKPSTLEYRMKKLGIERPR